MRISHYRYQGSPWGVLNSLVLLLPLPALCPVAQARLVNEYPEDSYTEPSTRPPLPKLLQRDDTIPASPPWVFPSAVETPPSCLSPGSGCPFLPDYTTSCSAEKCTVTFIGACMQRETMINKDCICESLRASTCSLQCSGTRNRAAYLYWLNDTCGDLQNWHGLPNNWTDGLPGPSFLHVGDRGVWWFGKYYPYDPSIDGENVSPCLKSSYCKYLDMYRWSDVVNSTCTTGFESLVWEPNLYNAADAAIFSPGPPGAGYSPSYESTELYDVDHDPGVYIDLKGFCNDIYGSILRLCSGTARTALLLWASAICSPPRELGWPANWRDTLLIYNATRVNITTFIPPIAPGPNYCSGIVNSTIRSCTVDACKATDNSCIDAGRALDKKCFCKEMDLRQKCNATLIERTELDLWLNRSCQDISQFAGLPETWQDDLMIMNASYQDQRDLNWPSMILCDLGPEGDNCSSTVVGVKLSRFCNPVNYKTTCNRNCKLSWERERYLNWMNSTCSSVSGWDGLPKNWTTLLTIQDYELLPWDWRIQIMPAQPLNAANSSTSGNCPSAAKSLGAFAAVNAAMAVLVPILGRRDVMKKLTRGLCGHRGSRMWLLTGPLTVALHIVSNVIGAFIIKSTPGFGDVDVGQLILLWCTRPRIAWVIIALIPWQAEDAIYFSVASSTLLAEIVLQSLGVYYMGVATNYARIQRFYEIGRLQHASRGQDAATMYAGSIMWLSVVVIAVATCLWSILGISNYVSAIAYTIKGFKRKAMRARGHAHARALSLRSSRSIYEAWVPEVRNLEGRKQEMVEAFSPAIDAQHALARAWESLRIYVTDDTNRLVKSSKALRKQRKADLSGVVKEAYDSAYEIWMQTPSDELVGLKTFQDARVQFESRAQELRNSITDENHSTTTELNMLTQKLSAISTRVQVLQSQSQRYRKWRNTQAGWGRASEATFLLETIDHLEKQNHRHWRFWKLSKQHRLDILFQLRTELARGINFESQVQYLKGPQNPSGDQHTQAGLKSLIGRFTTKSKCEKRLLRGWDDLCTSWKQVGADHAQILKIWVNLEKKRKKEEEERQNGKGAMLKKIALRCIAGMFGCWTAQWVWWVGYVRVSGDSYCPPRLSQIATVWTVFSALGAILGGTL